MSASSPSGHFRVERGQSDGAVRLTLRGELDIESSATLTGALHDHENAGAGRIVIDLSGLEFIDSTGISALVQARHQAEQANQQLVLTNLPHSVSRLFEITGISSQFTIT